MADKSVLDPALLEFVETLEADPGAEAHGQPVAVMIAVSPEERDEVVSQMQALGLSIGTVAGDVVSGRLDPAGIGAISDLSGVIKMELAQPMAPEESEPIDYTE